MGYGIESKMLLLSQGQASHRREQEISSIVTMYWIGSPTACSALVLVYIIGGGRHLVKPRNTRAST